MIKACAGALALTALALAVQAQDAQEQGSRPTMTLEGDDGSVRSFEIPPEMLARLDQSAIDDLVDSFDSPACLKARPTYRGHQDDVKGRFFLRIYEAPTACAEELNTAMKSFEFRRIAMNAFAGGSIDGTTERLRFGYAVAPDTAVIAWEVDVE